MYFTEAARSLYSTKQRTLLALIGIVIGIGSVIALVSIGNIVSEEAAKEFRTLGTDVVTVAARADDVESLRNPSLFRKLPNAVSCVNVMAPYLRVFTNLSTEDEEVLMLGVEQSFQDFTRFQLASGRFISRLDADRPYAVLGAGIAKALGIMKSPEQLIDQEIFVDDHVLRVVGVLQPFAPLPSIRVNSDLTIFLPLQYALKSETSRPISLSAARTQLEANAEQCAADISTYFKRRIQNLTLEVSTAAELIAQMRKQADMLAVLLTAIGSISLVVGGVGIMNIMLVSVSERKQEIGIRRALGAKRKDIRAQFLIESILLSLIGGLLGIIASIITTYYVAHLNGWTFFVSWQAIVFGAGISAGIGVFFGFIPAHQAAKLDPIQALRGE